MIDQFEILFLEENINFLLATAKRLFESDFSAFAIASSLALVRVCVSAIKKTQLFLGYRKENIVIIGSGPAGLAATIEALKNNHKNRKIILILNRDDFTRTQVFRLDSAIMPYLESLLGSDTISQLSTRQELIEVTDVNDPYYMIQIKTLEHALFQQIQKYENLEIVRVKDSHEFFINKQNLRIEFKYKLKDIPFKYVIACDGSKHSVANDLSENIIYDSTQSTQIHDSHLTAVYKLSSGYRYPNYTYLSLLKKEQDQQVASKEMKEMGWRLDSSPEARIFVVNNVLYLGTECPTSDFNCDEWARAVLESYLPQSLLSNLIISDFSGVPPFQKFTVQLNEGNYTLIPFSHDGDKPTICFFQLGDALRKPHYQTGSGAQVALLEVRVLGNFFKSDEVYDDFLNYHAGIAEIRADNRARVESYLENRKLRELKSLVDNFHLCESLEWSEVGLDKILSFCIKNKDTAIRFLDELVDPSIEQCRLAFAIIDKFITPSVTAFPHATGLLFKFENIINKCNEEKAIHSCFDVKTSDKNLSIAKFGIFRNYHIDKLNNKMKKNKIDSFQSSSIRLN